jgi:hypothetical protein
LILARRWPRHHASVSVIAGQGAAIPARAAALMRISLSMQDFRDYFTPGSLPPAIS